MLITDNLFDLANAGAKYLRRLRDGRYQHVEGKANSTHTLHCTRPAPHIVKDAPKSVVRCTYDGSSFVDFISDEAGKKEDKAAAWLQARRELFAGATPLSAVAVPRGRSYKSFCAQRATAAANGSLYDKKKTDKTMKKPAPPAKKNSKPAASSVEKDTQNGMTRPKEGTTTRKVWDIADRLGEDRAAVLAECSKRKINDATAMTQYGKWRVYQGLAGKRTAKAAPAAKAKPAPAAKRKPAPPAKRKPTPPKAKPAAPAVEAPAAEAAAE